MKRWAAWAVVTMMGCGQAAPEPTTPPPVTAEAGEAENAVASPAPFSRLRTLRAGWGRVRAYHHGTQRVVTSPNGVELALWDAAKGELVAELMRGEPESSRVAFSADGRWLLAGTTDGSARVWSADGTLVRRFVAHAGESVLGRPDPSVRTIGMVPAGPLVTAGYEKVKVWSASGGELLREVDPEGGFKVVSSSTYVGSVGGTLRLRRIVDGSDVAKLPGMRVMESPRTVEHFPWFVTSDESESWLVDGRDGTATPLRFADARRGAFVAERMWLANTTETRLFERPSGKVVPSPAVSTALRDLAISDDGRLVAGSDEAGMHVWDAVQGRRVRLQSDRPSMHVKELRFSHDGALLAGASYDGVRLWRTNDGTEVGLLEAEQVQGLWFSKNGRELIVEGRTLIAVATDSLKRLRETGGPTPIVAGAMAIDREGRRLASVGRGGQVLDGETFAVGCAIPKAPSLGYSEVEITPGGALMVLRDPQLDATVLDGRCQPVPELSASKRLRAAAAPHRDAVAAVLPQPDDDEDDFDPDAPERTWPLVVVAEGSTPKKVADVGTMPAGMAWSAQDMLGIWDDSGKLQLVDRHTGKARLAEPARLEGLYQRILFSPDGAWVLVTGRRGSFAVWDVATGELVHTLETPPRAPMFEPVERRPIILFGRDGRSVIKTVRGGTLRVFDLSSRTWTTRVGDDGRPVTAAEYSGDGRFLIVALRPACESDDDCLRKRHDWREVVVYDATTFAEVGRMRTHPADVNHLASPRDGRTFFTSTNDAIAQWSLPAP